MRVHHNEVHTQNAFKIGSSFGRLAEIVRYFHVRQRRTKLNWERR